MRQSVHTVYDELLHSNKAKERHSWLNALFNEITFQLMILVSALLFICFGVPLVYCLTSIPLVLLGLYVIIYGTVSMKAAQVLYDKKPLACWVAETYEPYFCMKNPESCWYKILTEDEFENEDIKQEGYQRKVKNRNETF
ncbi:hypothetical protein JTB14_016802 [Gonioctena quinquepunctata]|nr:hypothetical protein JTB14_016802 [Gonioctena quinquepunctata]